VSILIDTCIWSLALRRKNNNHDEHIQELNLLISEYRALIIGPIRQEILSGINNPKQFTKLRKLLAAFPDLNILTSDYEQAAEFFNLTRSKGIQGSMIDFLICAVANRNNILIYTVDNDFSYFKKYIPIELHSVRYHP
jgi:hypothetical protein